ncbi:MAG TPA: UDP-N-acetylmuramate--L-alanine ligase [Candidatus Eisenbacteria bacterium]|nr:UDP-N-acetylmuramate--L-alanine ligase [Candidatus Eisenbacteria bacterium]
MKEQKHIHFVGIKGVGVAPLAIIAKEVGFTVSGSDIVDGFITDVILKKAGIIPLVGFEEMHVVGADLVITTGAHGGYDNEEVVYAKKNGIPVITQGEAVGKFMNGEILGAHDTIGISVTGTHGKTTTTALIAKILKDAHADPSWVIGTSEIPSLGSGGHFGKGQYFVAEADEYANEPVYDKTPKLLLQYPKIAVITNIEHDHPDVYATVDEVRKTFLQFANHLPKDGFLVTCGDDMQVQTLLKEFSGKVSTYGFSERNMFCIKNVSKSSEGISWNIMSEGKTVSLSMSVPGEHNAFNATAAYIVAMHCGVSDEDIKKSLLTFSGTKRRLEYVGQLPSGALLYDDYAHHPTEIQKTLDALKEKYPSKRIICVFQPHTYSRTKLLFDQFIDSLAISDEIIMSDIYSSKREAYDSTVSSAMLVERLFQYKPVILAKTLQDVVKYINQHHYGDESVIVTMGAGDIYTVANQILEHGSAPVVS